MAIKSIESFIETLKKFARDKGFEYFYRGHSDFNFTPLPSVYRNLPSGKISPYIKNEDKIFREVIIRTPSDFINETTAIEKLVKMQHYGLPTRILDITSNPLIALYFACMKNRKVNDGEVLVFRIPKEEVKFYDSDTVSILSNLSKRPIGFDITQEIEYYNLRKKEYKKKEGEYFEQYEHKENLNWFNSGSPISELLHEIKEEKPYFLPIIEPTDFNRVLAVRVKLNNNRILKQSGAFLLFGLDGVKSKPAQVPKSWVLNKTFENFDLRIEATKKDGIKKDLDAIAINDSTLYPELEKQTQYIKNLFSH